MVDTIVITLGLILLIIVLSIIAYILGRKKGESVKFGDKIELVNEKWKNKLMQLESKYELHSQQFKAALEHKQKQHELDLQKNEKEWQVKYVEDIAELKKLFKEAEQQIRKKSLLSSRRSLVGKYIERFVPFLSHVSYAPGDMQFLGQPIDYIVFDGLDNNKVDSITFLEVKTGNSKLTPRERSIKNVIHDKKVYWDEVRVDVDDDRDKVEEKDDTSIGELFDHIDEKIDDVASKFKKRHEQLEEETQMKFICAKCQSEYTELNSKKGKCPKCGSTEAAVDFIAKKQEEDENEVYECEFCGREYDNEDECIKHEGKCPDRE